MSSYNEQFETDYDRLKARYERLEAECDAKMEAREEELQAEMEEQCDEFRVEVENEVEMTAESLTNIVQNALDDLGCQGPGFPNTPERVKRFDDLYWTRAEALQDVLDWIADPNTEPASWNARAIKRLEE